MPTIYIPFGNDDDHFAKVPRTNAALRCSMFSANTLQCLTLFKNDDDPIEEIIVNYEKHLSLLENINEMGYENWFDRHIQRVKLRCGFMERRPFNKFLRVFKRLKHDNAPYINVLMVFLFQSDILLNNGVCLIHKDGKLPSRASKLGLFYREFARSSERQYKVTQGLDKNYLSDRFSLNKEEINEKMTDH